MADGAGLSPTAFGEFYSELYRKRYPARKPYMWHERAARELADGGAWKNGSIWTALSAPTGSGKTSLIECFLFALACTEGEPAFPRRLFWVVDRRNVVDQVHKHALVVAELIDEAPAGGLVAAVRERLKRLADGTALTEPVQVRLWRGGLADEAAMASASPGASKLTSGNGSTCSGRGAQPAPQHLRAPLSPVAAAVICSTVDQVGSRLLFRGYGVSPRSRPIEAALVGTDSLIVLDEAHLSGAFQATASAVANLQRETQEHRPPVQVMAVTATHSQLASGHVFEFTPAEREDPALAQRLAAERPVSLVAARNPVLACVKAARELADAQRQVIGVAANTVGSARRIAKALQPHGETVLVIGPARPLDRERLLERIPERDARHARDRPLFVVGTQTLEVGLDLDFDALVTECAPLNSLVQRFGRLDRAGDLTAGKKPGSGVIVQPPTSCPVYGEATTETWQYLCKYAQDAPLQFGADQVATLLARVRREAVEVEVVQPQPPLLQPWHVELFAQTSHNPKPDPYVAAFLRGEQAHEPADVQICWRADLTEKTRASWPQRVEARLPHPGELLSLSPGAAKRWLTHRGETDGMGEIGEMADIEGVSEYHDEPPLEGEESAFIRVPPPNEDGDVQPEEISLSQLHPGDVIVLPSSRGGNDEYGWDPSSRRSVSDLGNLSLARPRLLLSAAVSAPPDLLEASAETVRLMAREDISEEEAYERLVGETSTWLESVSQKNESQTPVERVAQRLSELMPPSGKAIRLTGEDDEAPTDVVLVPRQVRQQDTDPAVQYCTHAELVEARVTALADRLDLPPELKATLQTAARHHDLGKLDRRFQAWLNGGSAADPSQPLAKSERGPGTPRSWVARRDAGWPRYKRHEAESAALLGRVESWPPDVDRDLLLYLVSVHHGDGRPFRWYVPDREPVPVSAEVGGETVSINSDMEIPWSEHADRFVALNERFGAWGLAAIESLLVLADRSVSAEGS